MQDGKKRGPVHLSGPVSRRADLFILASTLVTGGAENVVKALATGLPDLGFDPKVLCLREPGETGREIAGGGVPVRARLAMGRFDPLATLRLASIMRGDRRAALLCLDHHDAIFHGITASRLAGLRPRVLAVHSTGLWGGRRTFSPSDRVMIGGFSRIVALARGHERYLVEREGVDPGRTTVINNGVDTARFEPADASARVRVRRGLGIPGDCFAIAIVAALRPEKNHGLLFEAFRRSETGKGSGRRPFILVVGDGPEAGRLKREASSSGLGDSVVFLGRREDVEKVLRASDISVLCSHPVVETFPLAVLESMSCGVPVISTRVGSVQEIIDDGVDGLLVEPGDSEGLAAYIDRIAGDPGTASRLAANARKKVVEKFSEESMVESYARMLEGLLDNPEGAAR